MGNRVMLDYNLDFGCSNNYITWKFFKVGRLDKKGNLELNCILIKNKNTAITLK